MMRLPPSMLCALALLAPMAGAALLPAPAVAAQAARDPAAEAYIQAQSVKVLAVLNDKGVSRAAKRRNLETLLDQVADIPRVTTFVLGKYNRSVTPAQRQQFAALFRRFTANVYESRLIDYGGDSLKVVGSTVRQPGDVVVATRTVGGKAGQPTELNWRVLKGADGRWRAVDMQVQGVWLAITQQQDFVSSIDNAGGNVDALIAQLQTQVAQQDAAVR